MDRYLSIEKRHKTSTPGMKSLSLDLWEAEQEI